LIGWEVWSLIADFTSSHANSANSDCFHKCSHYRFINAINAIYINALTDSPTTVTSKSPNYTDNDLGILGFADQCHILTEPVFISSEINRNFLAVNGHRFDAGDVTSVRRLQQQQVLAGVHEFPTTILSIYLCMSHQSTRNPPQSCQRSTLNVLLTHLLFAPGSKTFVRTTMEIKYACK
jgi:hypothetical protein